MAGDGHRRALCIVAIWVMVSVSAVVGGIFAIACGVAEPCGALALGVGAIGGIASELSGFSDYSGERAEDLYNRIKN